MAKEKVEKTHEEAVAQLEAAKENLKSAKVALREFKSENGIKKGVEPEDAKIKKGLEKLEAAVEKAQADLDSVKEVEKELKPRKDRPVKYEYPEGFTDKQKKQYRAKMRRDAKAAVKAAEKGEEKTEKAPKAEKAEKSEKAEKRVPRKKSETPEED